MGRRGCELEPSDAWSHHGVAHALIAAGRLTDGIKWYVFNQAIAN